MKITINEKEVSTKNLLIVIASAIATILIVAGVFFSIGNSVSAEREAVHTLTEMKKGKDDRLTQLNNEIQSKKAELDGMTQDVSNAKKYVSDRNKYDSEIEDKQKQVEDIDGQISGKQDEITELQNKIDSLKSDIEKAKGEPVYLPAGNLVVGKDLQPGRYSVTGDSNFIVYGILGDLKVNTILGSHGVESYVCTLADGDQLECHSANTFTPID